MTTEVDQMYVYPRVVGKQELKFPRKTRQKMRPVAELLLTIAVIPLFFIQLNRQYFLFVFCMIYERSVNECLTILTAAMTRARNRRQQRIPYVWSVPCAVKS